MCNSKSWSAEKAALAIVAVTLMLVSSAWAASEQVLYNFTDTTGRSPQAALIFDTAGNLYGTAASGGNEKACSGGCGVVFQLVPASGGGWTKTVIHTFTSKDGANPIAGMVFDKAGNLYGTTRNGGKHDYGVVFELTPTTGGGWTQKVLHTFYRAYAGELPSAGVVIDSAGNLYGTTLAGYFGAVYELMPTSSGWKYKVLHTFYGRRGKYLLGGLVLDQAGNLYGTTANGGREGGGLVFEMTPTASGPWTETVLYEFQGSRHGGKDGRAPWSELVFDGQGNLYGTTFAGGPHHGRGTIFKLTPSAGGWTETVLHYGGRKGGYGYRSGLIFDAAGNFYGTAELGAGLGAGAVFRLTPTTSGFWKETVLHSFGSGSDGRLPIAGLILDAAGNLYGTTMGGGTKVVGTVFEVTP